MSDLKRLFRIYVREGCGDDAEEGEVLCIKHLKLEWLSKALKQESEHAKRVKEAFYAKKRRMRDKYE